LTERAKPSALAFDQIDNLELVTRACGGSKPTKTAWHGYLT
jgi:hypothetical protein